MNEFRLMFSRKWWWTTLLVLGGIALTIRLGIWQVSRYHENKAVVDHLAAMQVAPSVTLTGTSSPEDLTGMEYRPVQASGTFDLSHQVAIRNQVWMQPWGNDVGFILVAPLIFPDGSAVLVDRGWIPLEDNTPASWSQFDQPANATVTGILRLSTRPQYGRKPDPTPAPGTAAVPIWNYLDIGTLQKQVPYTLLPVYIQQAPDPGDTSMPYKSLSQPDTLDPSTNVGYAFTWFAFAALLFGGYPLYLRRQKNSDQ
jgi:surfeit locus 1 family protein